MFIRLYLKLNNDMTQTHKHIYILVYTHTLEDQDYLYSCHTQLSLNTNNTGPLLYIFYNLSKHYIKSSDQNQDEQQKLISK